MAKKFKTGDVVQLKSGGPEMTVRGYETGINANLENYESDTEVVCEWFDDKNQVQQRSFDQDSLDSINDAGGYPIG